MTHNGRGPSRYKLVIVGDGIAGSLAAYVCAKLNIKALWFAPKNRKLSGAIQIPPNSVDALKNLGIFEDLKKHLTPISMIRMRDQFFKQDLSTIDVNNHYFSLAREELLSVLESSLKQNSLIIAISLFGSLLKNLLDFQYLTLES